MQSIVCVKWKYAKAAHKGEALKFVWYMGIAGWTLWVDAKTESGKQHLVRVCLCRLVCEQKTPVSYMYA